MEIDIESSAGVPKVLNRFLVLMVGLLCAALVFPVNLFPQDSSTQTWPEPVPNRPPIAEKDKKPAPRRSLVGMWGSREGNQSKGVHLHPNDGKPENQPPYTPHGLELYKSHKPLEGFDAVPPAGNNDPRARCEPLGLPRANHYDLGIQVFQDEYKIAMLYQYDNRWRIIWTDGRPLPKLLDGGVEIDGGYRESRWFGYSVGKWVDDYTLQVQTVGTMPEDRVWLDNTGRPISDQVRITETFRRLDYDTLEWSETLEDPKVLVKPWQTMKMQLRLQNPRADVLTRYCSPSEIDTYNKLYGDSASGK
jgi:hypothetical protein